MSSLIEEVHRREAAARDEAAGLRREIDALTERLAQAEERVARLEITRETVAEILGEADADRGEALRPRSRWLWSPLPPRRSGC
jgi:septal ring factor EnvC (AmiA/AmiB activator)